MPRRPRPPSIRPLGDLAKYQEGYAQLRRHVPAWAEGIIVGLLFRAPKKHRDSLAILVEDLVVSGQIWQATLGAERAKAQLVKKIRTYDRRRGGDHPRALIRLHGNVAWPYLEQFPFL